MSIPTGNHIHTGLGRALLEALHGGCPVHPEGTLVLFADHDLGPIDKGAAHDRMDRLRAKTGALAQDIIADGRKGGTIHHALIHIVAEGLELGIHLLPEGGIRHHGLEIIADGGEGSPGVRPLIEGLFQDIDEHLPNLVFGFHDQDGILPGKGVQVFRRSGGKFEYACCHSYSSSA